MIPLFLSALTVGFSGAMMPGSLLTYTIRQSLASGPKSGFIIILGHALLELALIICIFLGLDILLKSNIAQIVIGILGGLLLCYMGIDMIIQAARKKITVRMDSGKDSTKSMLLSGVVISAANPYFLLWWAVIGLGFLLEAYRNFAYLGVAVYFIGHLFADFLWYGLISVVVGNTRKFIKEKPYRIAIMLLGGLLIVFGARFFVNAISSLI
jgi:threonine/homoserine/homoserine lactone efflux protein